MGPTSRVVFLKEFTVLFHFCSSLRDDEDRAPRVFSIVLDQDLINEDRMNDTTKAYIRTKHGVSH